MTNAVPSLQIGLIDNACHSLQRGYEMWRKGRKKKDVLLLKEAIIWIHHGIELSLKQLLVQTNEYLVFANVDEAVRKLAHLRRQPGMDDATVLDLFEYGEGVYTVGFRKLVERVAIMLDLEALSQDAPLRKKIDKLADYRNKIVHFSVEVNADEVTSLLADLMGPFLELLEKEIDNEEFIRHCLPYVRASAESVSAVFKLRYSESEERIVQLLERFDGQRMAGELLGWDGTLELPPFTEVVRDVGLDGSLTLPGFTEVLKVAREKTSPSFRIDVLARSDAETWLVEIKLANPNMDQVLDLQRLRQGYQNARLWLIVMGTDQIFHRRILQQCNILSSSEADIKQLEEILQ